MKSRKKFSEYIALLSELFDKEITAILRDAYWKILEPYTDPECEKAFKFVISEARFFPKPADFLSVLRGNQEERALMAWVKVDGAVKVHGQYVSVRFDDPVIHSVIDSLGGWSKFQDCTEQEWTWRQKEFVNRYRAMERKDEHLEYLPGLIETQNTARNYTGFVDPPIDVCEKPKLKLIEGKRHKQVEGRK